MTDRIHEIVGLSSGPLPSLYYGSCAVHVRGKEVAKALGEGSPWLAVFDP
jgi:hypothetical protein